MKRYKLTATRGTESYSVTLQASNDEEAYISGIFRVLDLAHDQDNAWAMGEVKLIRPDGTVLDTMPAKESA